MIQFASAARTDVGAVRENNEDSAFAGTSLVMVADGVGGAAAGEVASASATYVVTAAALMEGGSVDPATLLGRAVAFANQHIWGAATERADRAGMSTTLTAILTDGDDVVLAHIGDSRAYLFRNGRLRLLTRDDSVLQDLLDSGGIRPDDARRYPYRNLITKSLGQAPGVTARIEPVRLEVGDRLLVCSDGVTDVLTEAEVQHAMSSERSLAVEQLVADALSAGGTDNITCVVADVVDRPWVRPFGTLVGAAWEPQNLIDGSAVRATRQASADTLCFH